MARERRLILSMRTLAGLVVRGSLPAGRQTDRDIVRRFQAYWLLHALLHPKPAVLARTEAWVDLTGQLSNPCPERQAPDVPNASSFAPEVDTQCTLCLGLERIQLRQQELLFVRQIATRLDLA